MAAPIWLMRCDRYCQMHDHRAGLSSSALACSTKSTFINKIRPAPSRSHIYATFVEIMPERGRHLVRHVLLE